MKAIALLRYGAPEVLRPIELPDLAPGPGEVLVRVRAAGVNPTDISLRSGARATGPHPGGPLVPGMDIAGILSSIGPATQTALSVGDDVMGVVVPEGSRGGYAEQVVLPARSVVAMPPGATYAQAASVPMNGLTALRALDLLALEAGDVVAVTGGAGAVGGASVQLAKLRGLRVIADAGESDRAAVLALGADTVVARGPQVGRAIRAIQPSGVDALIDGAVYGRAALEAVRTDGGFAALRAFDGETERGIAIHQVSVRDSARDQTALNALRNAVEAGALSMRVNRVLPADEATLAHQILSEGGTRGRIILEF